MHVTWCDSKRTSEFIPCGVALYGEARLARLVAEMLGRLCRERLSSLLADILSHAADAHQSDDITMLMFRRVAAPKSDGGRITMKLEFSNNPESLNGTLDSLEAWMERNAAAPALMYSDRRL